MQKITKAAYIAAITEGNFAKAGYFSKRLNRETNWFDVCDEGAVAAMFGEVAGKEAIFARYATVTATKRSRDVVIRDAGENCFEDFSKGDNYYHHAGNQGDFYAHDYNGFSTVSFKYVPR